MTWAVALWPGSAVADPIPKTRTSPRLLQKTGLENAAARMPRLGETMANFTLPDTEGRRQELRALQQAGRKTGEPGRPVALFVFCGCPWCLNVARAWVGLQQGGALPEQARTIIIFQGDAAEARSLSERTGLNPATTVLLADPMLRVSEGVLHAGLCPRVFVVDGGGIMRYVNNRPQNAPRVAPATIITTEAAAALAACVASPLKAFSKYSNSSTSSKRPKP